MDPCFEATDEAIDIAQDYLVVRAKLDALRKKIDLIRKKIGPNAKCSVLTKMNQYYDSLSYLINMSVGSMVEMLYFGREISYNAEEIGTAMNMEDEQ